MRVWRRWNTIRLRLTVWYAGLLGIVLVLFSGAIYVRLERSQSDRVDRTLLDAQMGLTQPVPDAAMATYFERMVMEDQTHYLILRGIAGRILRADGQVVSGFGNYAVMPRSLPPAPGYSTAEVDEIYWRMYTQPLGTTPYFLQTGESLGTLYDTLEGLIQQGRLAIPLIVVLAATGGWFLATRALRPIVAIQRTAEMIQAGDLSQRIQYPGPPDEVGRLAATFDTMLDQIEAAFAQERRFTAEASHELRTPLTVMKGRLEVLLSRTRTTAEYQETLSDLQAQVDRLIRLSTDLLLMARLDQAPKPWHPQPLNITDLLETLCESMEALAAAKEIAVHAWIAPSLVVAGDFDQLVRVFLNILDNAIKYTPYGGRVSLDAIRQDAMVVTTIRDTGPGIPPEHHAHLFKRFYRVEADRSRSVGGAGLGLAIAFEITRWHGGTLAIQSTPPHGAAFLITLPLIHPPGGLGEERGGGTHEDLPAPDSQRVFQRENDAK